jgi:hypothetical protein
MYTKLKIELILNVNKIDTLENTKKIAEQILENMLKTRKSVAMYRITEHKLYANLYTAEKETNEIKFDNRCSKFDTNIKEDYDALAKNCEKCMKINKKCLIE